MAGVTRQPGPEAQGLRLRLEARVSSRMDHPGSCTVYEADQIEGATRGLRIELEANPRGN